MILWVIFINLEEILEEYLSIPLMLNNWKQSKEGTNAKGSYKISEPFALIKKRNTSK